MANPSEAQGRGDSGMELLRAKCGWIVALGIVYVVAGLVASSSIACATVASVFMVGVMMLFTGAVEVKAGSSWFWAVLSGATTALLGVVMLSRWPVWI